MPAAGSAATATIHLGQVIVTEGDVDDPGFRGGAGASAVGRAGRSVRRCVTSPECFDRSATPRSPGSAPRPRRATKTSSASRRGRMLWETWVSAAYLRAYLSVTKGAPFLPARAADFEAAAAAVHTGQGALRARVRAEQPARLGAHSAGGLDAGADAHPAACINSRAARLLQPRLPTTPNRWYWIQEAAAWRCRPSKNCSSTS